MPPRLPVAVLVVALAGCAHEQRADSASTTTPPPPALSTVRDVATRLVVCQTTEAELRRQLGPPYRDGRIAEGRVLSWLPAGDNDSKHYLAVLVRGSGDSALVVDEYFDVPTEIVWTPTDRCHPR